MTDKNDLKPGDFARHPKHPELIGTVSCDYSGVLWVNYVGSNGFRLADRDLTDWERVETVKPGHVQVRVDDLWAIRHRLDRWANVDEVDIDPHGNNLPEHNAESTLLIRVTKAIAAQLAESTPPTDGPEHDEKPTSTTVTLPCPDCGEAVTRTAEVWTGIPRNRILAWATTEWHTCPPAQPDEPTEFGARVTVTMADGSAEKWCRLGQHSPTPWLGEGYSVPGEGWDLLCRRGTVTIGWGDES